MKNKKILFGMVALVSICIIFIYIKANQSTDTENNMPNVIIQYSTDKEVNEEKGLYVCGYSWLVDGSLEIDQNDVNRNSIREIELKKNTKVSFMFFHHEYPSSVLVKEFRPEDLSDYNKGTIISDSLEPIACHSGYTYSIELFFKKNERVTFAFKCK